MLGFMAVCGVYGGDRTVKWLKITTFFLVLLLCANLYLGYNIYRQYVNTRLIGEDSLEKTALLLSESGIGLAEDAVGRVKPEYTVYSFGDFDGAERYYMNAATLISGGDVSDSLTQHMINNGVRIINRDNGDAFEFYEGGFELLYASGGDAAIYQTYVENADAYTELSSAAVKESVRQLERFLFGEESVKLFGADDGLGLEYKSGFTADGIQFLSVIQTAAGKELRGCEAVCAISGGSLRYISGSLVIGGSYGEYTASLTDQINVLFEEREYIGELNGGFSDDAADNVISSLECVYTASWSADRRNIYLVPAWKISYVGGYSHIRSMLSGNLCE